MIYNLQELSDYQTKLDKKIYKNHNLDATQTVERRILAFLVELGELANETRCFKYWSIKNASARQVILEEYVDGIHFLISLKNDLKKDFIFEITPTDLDLSLLFIDIFFLAAQFQKEYTNDNLDLLFSKYLLLGYNIGFNNEDIIGAYLEKNELNHQRQAENY